MNEYAAEIASNDGVHVVLLDQENKGDDCWKIKNPKEDEDENTGRYLPCEDIDYDVEWYDKVITERSGRTKLCFSKAASLEDLLEAI